MTSLRSLAIPDLVADPQRVTRLIAAGETLFVERKERDPKDGLGPTVASFANALGGWLLIGVDDDGEVVGYEPPGRVDLQDHIRQLLGAQVDPLPPFAAVTVPVGDKTIGVVRVAESSDQPHITSDGVIYVRESGGKKRVTAHGDLLQMARRGEEARAAAAVRQYGLPLIEEAMRTPERVYGDQTGFDDELAPLLEWIVRAAPYTVTGAFVDRALSSTAADSAAANVGGLFPRPDAEPHVVAKDVEARARGLHCVGTQWGAQWYADLAIDAGGIVAARSATRRNYSVLLCATLAADTFQPLIRAIADVLGDLDGYGRAAIGLEVRGATDLRVQWGAGKTGTLGADDLVDGHRLHIGGDLAVPADDDDIKELADRWARELARAARLPIWEPAADEPDTRDR